MILATAIIMTVLAILIIGFSWIFARLWCRPNRKSITKNPTDFGMSYENITFPSSEVELKGWLIKNNSGETGKPVIIVPHGWSSNASDMLPVANIFHKKGYSILLYNARGHGDSGADGPITIKKFSEDVVASLNFIKNRPDIDPERIGVLGHSIGGSASILAASMSSDFHALVSASAFSDPITLTRETLVKLHIPMWPFLHLICFFIERWLGTSMANLAPKNRIGEISAPILLAHGGLDKFIPPRNLDILYSYSREETTKKILIKGMGHSNIVNDPYLIKQVDLFFHEHLSFTSAKEVAAASS